MKKRKINITQSGRDEELFEPAMLMTLENQHATHHNFAEKGRCSRFEGKKSQVSIRSLIGSDSQDIGYSVQSYRSPHCSLSPSEVAYYHSSNLQPEELLKKERLRRDSIGIQLFIQQSISDNKKKKLLKTVGAIKETQKSDHVDKGPGILANASHLNNVLKEERKKNIQKNFIKKIRQKKISQLQYLQSINKLQSERTFLDIQGISLNEEVQTVFKGLEMFFTFVLVFLNTVFLVYQNALHEAAFAIKILAIVFYGLVLVLQMITVRSVEGRTISNLGEIWKNIGYDKLILDAINILIIILDISIDSSAMSIPRLMVMTKLPQVLGNLQDIEIKFISNYEKDKYWSLIKIMLLNFCFAHLLAVLLTAMAEISPTDNWMTVRNIHQAQWYQKYIWAYYWGTNIMLTVGFGDISATNYKEALCLIFIETVSCVVLAYNVSCVGDLIMNIKEKDCEKKNQIKIFRKITESNPVSDELNWKITNFIEESINLKKNFNYEQEYKFITNLPKYLKYDFLKETNKSVFNQLPFFQFMMEKTIYNLAEKIQMLMSHPEQIIRNKNDDFNLWILRSGEVGLIYNRPGAECNGQIIDKIVVKGNEPFILSLNFITKRQLPYEVKSLQYSSFYYLGFQSLIATLKQNISDFYYYAYMRDKIKNIPDQFEVSRCSLCKDRYHYKFDCPLIHYIPNVDNIIFTYLRDVKISSNKDRMNFQRIKKSVRAFEIYKYFSLQGDPQVDSQYSNNYTASLLRQTKRHEAGDIASLVLDDETYKNMQTININEMNDDMKDLKEFISGQLERVVQAREESDPVWMINLDVLNDYNSYFQADNPKNVNAKANQMRKKKITRLKMSTRRHHLC